MTEDQGLKVHKKTLGSQITIRACLLNGKSVKRTLLGAVYTEGVRSLYQEDPRRRSHPRAICFLYSVYIQRVVLVPTAKIFLVLRSSQLTGKEDPSSI